MELLRECGNMRGISLALELFPPHFLLGHFGGGGEGKG